MAEAIDLAKTATAALPRGERCDPAVDNGAIRPTREQVSGYALVRRLGRGGVAEVWEAESPSGYRVALKLIHLTSDLRSGELRALKITRGIRHPYLLMNFGTWQIGSLLVISMELADRTLWDRFLEANAEGLRGIPRAELLGYLACVADAVDYLNGYWHSVGGREGVGIQHRDLKPQNILLVGTCPKVGRLRPGHGSWRRRSRPTPALARSPTRPPNISAGRRRTSPTSTPWR